MDNMIDILCGKFFARAVDDIFTGAFGLGKMTDCLEQVCFSKAGSAINYQWIERCLSRSLGNGKAAAWAIRLLSPTIKRSKV
jgi:hypothetical protein